ncbi:hypothetical protein D3C77_797800 [compost metagenome]
MQHVAIGVELAAHLARHVHLPVDDPLALAVLGREAQELDAGAHLVGIAVGGVVANGQFHTTSR